MALANIQAQITNLTSLLSQMQRVGTFDHNQSRNDVFSNTYNSDWRDYSNFMWREPQQI